MMPSRRSFLAASLAAGALAATRAYGMRPTSSGLLDDSERAARLGAIGCGLFSIPKMLSADPDAAFAMLQKLGYTEVELYGPFPFSVPAVQKQWQQTAGMLGFSGSGFYGRTPVEFRKLLDAHGLKAKSAHADLDTMIERLDQVAEAAQILGMKYVGLPNISPERRKTLDDYRRMADVLNEIGAKSVAKGFKVLYHNHGYGLSPMEGVIPVRALFDRLDPSVVSLEMDLFWTIAGGADPVELLEAYPKLYRLMHVKDMSKKMRFAGDGNDAQQWFALFPYMTTAGAGVFDLEKILGTAKRVGVEHFYVEQDMVADPDAALGASIKYLRGLEV
jgi:sugar phosphate isomerase/epimerase